MRYYLLNADHSISTTDDLTAWAQMHADIRLRRVAVTEWDGTQVSTVFLGLDHGFGGPPLLFETMIFGGEYDLHCWRYSTWDEAVAGDAAIVARLRAGLPPSISDGE